MAILKPDEAIKVDEIAREAVHLAARRLQPQAIETLLDLCGRDPGAVFLTLGDTVGGRRPDLLAPEEVVVEPRPTEAMDAMVEEMDAMVERGSLTRIAREVLNRVASRLLPGTTEALVELCESNPGAMLLAVGDIFGGERPYPGDTLPAPEAHIEGEADHSRGLRLALELVRLAASETIERNLTHQPDPKRLGALAAADAVSGLGVALTGMLVVGSPENPHPGVDGGQLVRAAVGALVAVVALFEPDLIERQLVEARAVAVGISLARKTPEAWPS